MIIYSATSKDAPHWIHWTDDRKDYATCSKCGFGEEGELLLQDTTPYCPWCGAQMVNWPAVKRGE